MVKFPDGDASNSSGCVSVDDGKIARLKSYDYHVLLQRVLLIALIEFVNKDVSLELIEVISSNDYVVRHWEEMT